jgi:hypothetical protein
MASFTKSLRFSAFSGALLPLLLTVTIGGSLFITGCDDDDDEEETPRASSTAPGNSKKQEKQQSSAGSEEGQEGQTLNLVTLTEPEENAFTIQMPEGWKNKAAVVQVYDQKRPVATSTAPDGNTFLFWSDPQMPGFSIPTPQMNANTPFANMNPLLKISDYKPAKQFFTEYLTKKFGKLPDFRIVGTAPNPRLENIMLAEAQKRGMSAKVTATMIAFDYRDNDKLIRSMINGVTMKVGGIWIADLNGVSTNGDPTQYNDLLLQVSRSYKSNPAWQEKQREISRQRHEATMAMIRANTVAMTRRHEANMAWIQNSMARHNQRMASLHAAGDAQMAAWKDRQAQSDASHERFLNYVKGEETVVNSSGVASQVQAGQGTYFLHKTNNTYVGMDSTKELEDLRKVWGLNPDDYEQGTIKR